MQFSNIKCSHYTMFSVLGCLKYTTTFSSGVKHCCQSVGDLITFCCNLHIIFAYMPKESFFPSNSNSFILFVIIFKILYLFFERGKGRERGRKTSMRGCPSHAPFRGAGLQLRHVPQPGIKPPTLWFAG